ncbi:hypothetical protein LY01_02267 [Nonlabens xylanidelens]|uniref:Uncharacterized protein n=1 Tax=Nonlabens xylanidelens TaxID=191564 RepID=A0A2S6IIN3_9FLAO|nr:hypothetical protein LY01_02267 [Nonlabens xylanidelens]
MKKYFPLIVLCFLTISCSDESNDDIQVERNMTLNINEEHNELLSLERDQRTHTITRQANIFETSEIIQTLNASDEEMSFFTFKPQDSFTGEETVIITTIETSSENVNNSRKITTTYNFTVQ